MANKISLNPAMASAFFSIFILKVHFASIPGEFLTRQQQQQHQQ